MKKICVGFLVFVLVISMGVSVVSAYSGENEELVNEYDLDFEDGEIGEEGYVYYDNFKTMDAHVSDGFDVILHGNIYGVEVDGDYGYIEVMFRYRENDEYNWTEVGSDDIFVDGELEIESYYYLLEDLEPETEFKYEFIVDGEVGEDNVVVFETDDSRLGEGERVIENWKDLCEINDGLTADYELANDLDSDTDYYEEYASDDANDGIGWVALGNVDGVYDIDNRTPFMGSFEGNGYEISDLYIDVTDEPNDGDIYNIGIFAEFSGNVSIRNLDIRDFDIKGQWYMSSLVGRVDAEDFDVDNIGVYNSSIGVNYDYNNVTLHSSRVGTIFGCSRSDNMSINEVYISDCVDLRGRVFGGLGVYLRGDVEINDVYVGVSMFTTEDDDIESFEAGGIMYSRVWLWSYDLSVNNVVFTGNINIVNENYNDDMRASVFGIRGSSSDDANIFAEDVISVEDVGGDVPFKEDIDDILETFGEFGKYSDEDMMSYDFYENTTFDIANYDDYDDEIWNIKDGFDYPRLSGADVRYNIVVLDSFEDVELVIDFGDDDGLYDALEIEINTLDSFIHGDFIFGERTETFISFDDSNDNISGDFDVYIDFDYDDEDEDIVDFDNIGSWRDDVVVAGAEYDEFSIIDEPVDFDTFSVDDGDGDVVFNVEVEDASEFDGLEIYTNPSIIMYLSMLFETWGLYMAVIPIKFFMFNGDFL